MANAEQRGDPELKATSPREQHVQKVMFTPFGKVRSKALLKLHAMRPLAVPSAAHDTNGPSILLYDGLLRMI